MSADQYAELAERGAVQLAEAMTTERWPEARDVARRMFALLDAERCAALVGQLDRDEGELIAVAADLRERMRERFASVWEGRLGELLLRNPAVFVALQELVGVLRETVGSTGGARSVVYRQHIEAKDHGTSFGAQGGHIYYYGSTDAAPAFPSPGSEPPVPQPADDDPSA